ncbi:Uu.00g041270.m01.CDS01 [Anthostomella pinea]|uniref:Uu.00g041270.m01.CDS01 n=1 Tax=Anthostomella pinea TaxID=933095 RepID=A0AAI8VAB9_9PEZI|nr:Uu.00g041270.m01.CDS01 [Anthostomella pinea]
MARPLLLLEALCALIWFVEFATFALLSCFMYLEVSRRIYRGASPMPAFLMGLCVAAWLAVASGVASMSVLELLPVPEGDLAWVEELYVL